MTFEFFKSNPTSHLQHFLLLMFITKGKKPFLSFLSAGPLALRQGKASDQLANIPFKYYKFRLALIVPHLSSILFPGLFLYFDWN